MITFKQYLLEIQSATSAPEVAAKLVFENCQHFLKESGFFFTRPDIEYGVGSLFRGMHDVKEHRMTEVSGTRLREPKDSSKMLHQTLDDHLAKKFGYPYRSKGVFCSAKESIAESYGKACLIFPVGDFKYAFSTIIEDAYVDLDPKGGWSLKHRILETFREELYEEFMQNFKGAADLPKQEIEHEYQKFLSNKFGRSHYEITADWWNILARWLDKENPYQDHGLNGMLHGMGISSTEIMIQCEKYYLVPIAQSNFSKRFAGHLIELMHSK